MNTVGLTGGELFDDPSPVTPTDALPPAERQQPLARIITASTPNIVLDQKCVVFGFTLNQLRADLVQLTGQLTALEFRQVAGSSNKVLLARSTDPSYDGAKAGFDVLRDGAEDLNLSSANTLLRDYKQTLSTRGLSNNVQVQLAALTKRGVIAPPSSNYRTPLTRRHPLLPGVRHEPPPSPYMTISPTRAKPSRGNRHA